MPSRITKEEPWRGSQRAWSKNESAPQSCLKHVLIIGPAKLPRSRLADNFYHKEEPRYEHRTPLPSTEPSKQHYQINPVVNLDDGAVRKFCALQVYLCLIDSSTMAWSACLFKPFVLQLPCMLDCLLRNNEEKSNTGGVWKLKLMCAFVRYAHYHLFYFFLFFFDNKSKWWVIIMGPKVFFFVFFLQKQKYNSHVNTFDLLLNWVLFSHERRIIKRKQNDPEIVIFVNHVSPCWVIYFLMYET